MEFNLRIGRTLGAFALLFATTISLAASHSLVGRWQTKDKRTHQASSVIQIWKSKGKYFGKVAKIYPVNGAKTTDICKKCRGALHNKPMLGLPIIKDMVLQKGKYVGGKILDPRNGKEYHCVFYP